MTSYAEHFSTRETPQTEQADARQVPNDGGGFSFQITPWQQLERFLILGCDGGSYYATEKAMTIENAKAVIACLDLDGPRTVETIAQISDAGRAPKNDPAIFALAIASGHKNDATRKAALAALPRVCRIGTHLFQFAAAVKGSRGWGRGLRRAIGLWYSERSADQVAFQVAKYGQREGWSHRDMMRLAHPDAPTPEHAAVYRYIVSGAEGLGDRELKGKAGKEALRKYPSVGELPAFLAAFEELKATRDTAAAIKLIREHGFTHEMVPSELKGSPELWEALLEKMPVGAMIRNLGKMTSVGLLKPMAAANKLVTAKLEDREALRHARIHPISVLSALKVYQQNHGEKGSLTWESIPQIMDALDAAFYLAFETIEPTGKPTLLALDVSGSMHGSQIAGIPGLTARIASAAMAMVTARVEKDWHIMAFSSGFIPLNITPRQRLDDVLKVVSDLHFDYTDCAKPMTWALEQNLKFSMFQVYTDSDTNARSIHPHQALVQYRQRMGMPAKLAVVATEASAFSIADPSDSGMLDCVGFDISTPAALADFAR